MQFDHLGIPQGTIWNSTSDCTIITKSKGSTTEKTTRIRGHLLGVLMALNLIMVP